MATILKTKKGKVNFNIPFMSKILSYQNVMNIKTNNLTFFFHTKFSNQ